jgi:hypothetical protein
MAQSSEAVRQLILNMSAGVILGVDRLNNDFLKQGGGAGHGH